MIERYTRFKMSEIWNLTSKFQTYLDVELAVCEAYFEIGVIPEDALISIKKNVTFNLKRINEIETKVGHDVIAFLTDINESVKENAKYFHMGLTSSDVIDTALAIQIKKANKIIEDDCEKLFKVLKKLAKEHKNTVCIGRSHGVHAEIMTFGIKILNWLDAFERVFNRFKIASKEVEVGKISGPVGTYSNISPEIEIIVCKKLGLSPSKISTQIIPRDNHAYYMQSLALIASVIEQFATQIRHFQQTEILEVEEGFSKSQKGSSAMPHKKNPISCENLCGLARLVRSNANASLENIALWYERDISHSSVERIIFPDNTILIDYMLNKFLNIIENLKIYPDNMKKNANLFGGIVYSQKVLLELTKKGLKREDAYQIVQKNALDAFNKYNGNFKNNLLSDKNVTKILSIKEIDACFCERDYLENIEKIYKRFNLKG